jgi:hypothetical protein
VNLNSLATQPLDRYALDPRQFLDARESRLPDGSRILDCYNGSGLTFTLLPDRGLDIWSAHYNGIPLTYISPGSPFPPDEGGTWLRQFNGGLLTTCGMMHVGPPETDAETGEFRDLHGRFTRLRAQDLHVNREGFDSLHITARMYEQRLHGEQIEVTRWYTLDRGEPTIRLADVVTNLGDAPVPLMALYHINLGYPLVAAGARLWVTADAPYPRDAAAREGLNRWYSYEAAEPRYAEQVFFHHVKHGRDGMAEVLLLNGDFGFSISWNAQTMPYLTQWKNTRQGQYINGIEPGNCIPEGQNSARQHGRLEMLEPGESRAFNCQMTVLANADAVSTARERIDALDVNGTPAASVKLDDFAG